MEGRYGCLENTEEEVFYPALKLRARVQFLLICLEIPRFGNVQLGTSVSTLFFGVLIHPHHHAIARRGGLDREKQIVPLA